MKNKITNTISGSRCPVWDTVGSPVCRPETIATQQGKAQEALHSLCTDVVASGKVSIAELAKLPLGDLIRILGLDIEALALHLVRGTITGDIVARSAAWRERQRAKPKRRRRAEGPPRRLLDAANEYFKTLTGSTPTQAGVRVRIARRVNRDHATRGYTVSLQGYPSGQALRDAKGVALTARFGRTRRTLLPALEALIERYTRGKAKG